ncbi:MAG: AsmA family protein, partial [Candidatus Binatia bacterium]
MTVFARAGLKLLVLLLLACLIISFALVLTFKSARFKAWLQTELSQRTGYEIRLAGLGLEFPLDVTADKLEISKPGQLHLSAERVAVSLTPLGLISKAIYRLEIDKPLLHLDVHAFTQSSSQTSLQIAIRRLNVRDGAIVIKNGEETVIELPNLNVNAEHLNLGEQSGISLRTDVPALAGEAELRVKGRLRQSESDLIIRAKQSSGILNLRGAKAGVEMLRLNAKLTAPSGQQATLAIEGKFHEFPAGGIRVTGTLNGRADIDQNLAAGNFTGRAELAEFPNSLIAAFRQLPTGAAIANFGGAFSFPRKTLTIKTLQVSSHLGQGSGTGEFTFGAQPGISGARIDFRDIPLNALRSIVPAPANAWTYNGRAAIDVALQGPLNSLHISGVARSADAAARTAGFAAAKISFTAPFEWVGSTLQVKEARVQATQLTYEKNRWQGTAERLDASATMEYRPAEPVKVSGRLETGGGKFSAPDSARVGENIALGGPFALVFDPVKNVVDATATLQAQTGEILWGKFFGDLKTQKPVLDIAGDYQRGENLIELRRASLGLAGVGHVDATGSIEIVGQSPRLRLQLHSGDFLPGGFYDFFLRDTFSRQYPLLDRLAASGKMTFQAQVQGPIEALTAAGNVSLQAGELRAKSNDWQIGPISLDLPFQISLGGSERPPNPTQRSGTLAIGGARFAKQSIAPIKTTMSLSNNRLRFLEPVSVKIFGGEIIIANLSWPDLLNEPKRVSFSAELKRLQLESMTAALDWPRFSGTLTGSIPEVQSLDNALRTKGEIHAELFGGGIAIGKLEIENPFSSLPSVKLDAKVDGIELEQLSKTFAFGRISGILEGTIEDLVVTDGQPAQMRADFHSVDRGTEQRISVEALNKITVLSSGQGAGALYGGLASFFDSFRYSKLGFKATLRN